MVQEGRNAQYNSGQFYGINLSHSFSSRSFFELNTNQFTHRFESYLYEDPLDPRYITPDSLYWAHIEGTLPTKIATEYGQEVNYFPQYTLGRWGVETSRYNRETITQSLKLDYTSQINKYNQILLIN